MRVVAGGGAGLTHTPRTQAVRRKGIAANRARYDARRRRTARSEDTRDYMRVLAGDPCAFCGAPACANRTGISDRDHIVPLDRGGLDRWENMTAACARCNRGRRDTDLLTFLARRRDTCPSGSS